MKISVTAITALVLAAGSCKDYGGFTSARSSGGGGAGSGVGGGAQGGTNEGSKGLGGSARGGGNIGLPGSGGSGAGADARGSGGVSGLGDPSGGSSRIDNDSGNAGSDAGAINAGGAYAAGAGNSAGEGGQAGADGASAPDEIEVPETCKIEETIIPECRTDIEGFVPMTLPQARGIGVAPMAVWGAAFHVFASKAASNMMGIFWGDALGWVSWNCFDVVPDPYRVAAARLRNGFSEVFVTTDCGQLHVRRMLSITGWSPWMNFGLPTGDSWVTDVTLSLSHDDVNMVYVADRGRVFMRHRIGEEPYAPYGAWTLLDSGATKLLAAALRPDGKQQVFTIDHNGEPRSCIQSSPNLDAPFDACLDFDSADVPKLIDIDVPEGAGGGLLVFGLAENGALWLREQDIQGNFSPWMIWRYQDRPPALIAIASAGVPTFSGLPLVLLGVGASGGIYGTKRVNGSWDSWQLLPP